MKIGRFSFSSFKKKSKDPFSNNYVPDDWGTLYNSSSRWRRKKPGYGGWKTLYRILAALVIFAVLLAFKESTNPWSVQAREGLRVALTTEWDVMPALDRAVQIGLKTVNMDWPMFEEFSGPVKPAISESKPDGSWAIPVSGQVVQEFGWVKSPEDNLERFNPGIDIAAETGTSVQAVQPGKVSRIGHDRTYGEFVLVEHRKGEYALYAGLTGISVQEGHQIQAGQEIGKVAEPVEGKPLLHFEVRENDKLVDPLKKINLTTVITEEKNDQQQEPIKGDAEKKNPENSKP